MKSSIILIPLSAFVLAGCATKPVPTREVVVEKPVVVQKETVVVEKPVVVQKETVVVEKPVLARSCTLGSTSYSHGSLSCQNRYEFRCRDGTWEGLNTSC